MGTCEEREKPPKPLRVNILENCDGGWKLNKNCNFDPSNLPKICYVFFDGKPYRKFESVRVELLDPFRMPDFLAGDTCTNLNGYFGCEGEFDDDGKPESYRTWFRCLVKMIEEVVEEPHIGVPQTIRAKRETTKDKDYVWHEMGIFTSWDSDCRRVLCVDAPIELHTDVQTSLGKRPPLDLRDPFAMFQPLIDQIVKLSDDSVWRFRPHIRYIEKNRVTSRPDFANMHNLARHAIHVSEVLSVTIETIESIQSEQKEMYKSLEADLTKTYCRKAQEYTRFQLQMVKSLKMRSDSNYQRLKNEITLGFNMIAQQDNTIIKSIALLTMAFLPATFISALFSTTFFSFSIDNIVYSSKVWVYWAITIPSTLLIVIFWRFWINGSIHRLWQRFLKRRAEAKSHEGGQSV